MSDRRAEDWTENRPEDFEQPSLRPADRYDLIAWLLIFFGCLAVGLTVLAAAAWWRS